MRIRTYVVAVLVMCVVDWTLGVLQAHNFIPTWTFAVANFPFGLPFVWLEYHWAGTHYEVNGQVVGEVTSMMLFFFAVLGQAWLYALLGNKWRRRHGHPVGEEFQTERA
jgi:hypothetical protein